MKIVALWTGLSEESGSTKLAELISEELSTSLEAHVTHVNLRTCATDVVTMATSGFASPKLEAVMETVRNADLLVSVCPIYNAAPLGLHTLFFQLLGDRALESTVVVLGATGGTVRHSLAVDQLRGLMSYLKGTVVPTSVFVATDDWASTEFSPKARISQAVAEACALVGRPRISVPESDFVPLADMLGES